MGRVIFPSYFGGCCCADGAETALEDDEAGVKRVVKVKRVGRAGWVRVGYCSRVVVWGAFGCVAFLVFCSTWLAIAVTVIEESGSGGF